MFWNKKGGIEELILPNLFAVIFALFIGIALYLFVSSFAESTYMERQMISKDISLTLDTTLASPNDLVIYYPRNIEGFQTIIKNEKGLNGSRTIIGNILGDKVVYMTASKYIPILSVELKEFIYPTKDILDSKNIKPYTLQFHKTRNNLEVTANGNPFINQQTTTTVSIPQIQTTMLDWRTNSKIYVDIPSDNSPTSLKNILGDYECRLLEQQFNVLLTKAKDAVKLTKNSVCDNEDIQLRKTKVADSNLIIVLRKNERTDDKIYIYYEDNGESEKLASLIGLEISKDNLLYELKKVSELTDEYNGQKEILSGKIGVIYFMGSVENRDISPRYLANAVEAYFK